MLHVQKVQLPPTNLGEDRCFEIGYFGHGDIVITTWNGPTDREHTARDGLSTRFGLAHGRDVFILASLAGYLKRIGRTEESICETLHEAGHDILSEDMDDLRYYYNLNQGQLNYIANGEPEPRFDIAEPPLSCLMAPVPSQPGILEQTGGTGTYTKQTNGSDALLVFAGILPTRDMQYEEAFQIDRTAEFCEEDIPAMARCVCNLALGEYQRDLQAFLTTLYKPEDD